MKYNKLINLLIITSLLVACEKNDENEAVKESQMLPVAMANSTNESFGVELLSVDTLFDGYNKLYFKITDKKNNQILSQADIQLYPLMNMTTMKHAAPKENPKNKANEKGYFEGAVVFIMPSNPDEGWTLGANIEANGMNDSVSLTIPVVKSLKEPKRINLMTSDKKRYFISLLEPSKPIVGINEIEFTVHFRENMMNFPAVEDISISIEPEMPSMGHGSPNNEDPVHIGNGHYKGKVNFTMTGWWRINLSIKQGTQLISDSESFNITF